MKDKKTMIIEDEICNLKFDNRVFKAILFLQTVLIGIIVASIFLPIFKLSQIGGN